ncbi:MAG: response regulator [Candidatus Symbiothrix sp.]|jgi:pentatricopeptide repeat protein|nr:response regulator [Candidatus Symbiothrix sp.]
MEDKLKVLIVEDEGTIYSMIKEQMNQDEYEFVRARNVSEAIDVYEQSQEEGEKPFDCYVVDLQIDSSGLTEQEMSDFYKREGYAWMKNYIFNSSDKRMNDSEKLNFKKKTIICSKYVSAFEKEYSSRELNGLELISKKPYFEEEVKNMITKICKKSK